VSKAKAPDDARWYRRLLRILPLDFRSDYGREMEQVFRDQQRDAAAHGRMGLVRVWVANAGAVLAIGPREHAAQLAQDVRYALRGMRAHPGFVIVALVMIALGTGANAAMFSVIDAVMLRTPFQDPERLAVVRVVPPGRGPTNAVSLAQYRSLIDSAPALAAVGALGSGARPTLAGVGEPRRLNVECFTAGVFQVLGVPPVAGRTFTADEDRPGGPSALVLSYDFWQRELGGSPDAVGRAVSLNGVPTSIVGIMPRRFLGPLSRNGTEAWLPLGPGLEQRSAVGCAALRSVMVFARVAPGTTFDAAAARATASAGIERIPDWQGKTGGKLSLISLHEQTFYELRTPLYTLLGAVGLVLLIACANVANLQLERVFGRRQELAIRLALGATRGRIVRQTLTENLMLYLLGSAAGSLLAFWTLDLVVALMPGNIPHLREIEINARILAATLLVAGLAGMAVGLFPALQATSPALVDDLRTSSRSATRGGQWTRQVLVAGQIALSLMLLVGAALMVRTFLTLRPSDPGFMASDKATGFIRLQGPAAASPRLFFDNLFERLRGAPGVQAVSGSTYLPMSGTVGVASVTAGDKAVDVFSGAVTPNYFVEMAIPVRRGRVFDERDTAGSMPVAVVNEALVRKLFPGGDALGAIVPVKGIDGRTESRQIVGVLRDTRFSGGDTKPRAELYVPYAQSPTPYLNIILRTSNPQDPRLAAVLREAVAAIDRAQTVDRVSTLDAQLDAQVAIWRFGAWLLGTFAGLALVLAAVGLAAAIAWWVAQRTREIGVRMALGANPGQVTRLVVRQGLTLAGIGIVLGLGGAAASTRLLESWLYGVKPLDAPTFAWSAAGMVVLAALASCLPARRAARIDPLVTLRAE
jgi:putative ABC transport system permease protein